MHIIQSHDSYNLESFPRVHSLDMDEDEILCLFSNLAGMILWEVPLAGLKRDVCGWKRDPPSVQ